MVDLVVGQGRGGLVQDQQLRVGIQGAADLQKLLFAGFQFADHGGGIDVYAQVFKELPGAGHLLLIPQQAESGQLAAEKDVVRHRQVVDHVQFLVDKGDAGGLHLVDGGCRVVLAAEGNASLIGGDDAGENVHQGRFSRAILAQQRVDLALLHRQVDVGQGLGAAECLGNMIHFKDVHRCCLLASGWRRSRLLWKCGCRGVNPCTRANGRASLQLRRGP